MPTRTFSTRRQWHNTWLMVWVIPFLGFSAILVLSLTGSFIGVVAAMAISVLGLVVALMRDAGDRSVYSIKNDQLVLQNKGHTEVFSVVDVIDASLIDRVAAREYIRGRSANLQANGRQERREILRRYTRFCTVDIGITSLTLGFGRRVIDRLPLAKNDLVLLRLKGGRDILLSPKYNQDLVTAVGRLISARPG